MNPSPAREGIHAEWIEEKKTRLCQIILPAAEIYFAQGGTPFTQNNPALKKSEMVQRFYDYQPCVMSVLGTLVAAGEERALVLMRRIFDNARTCIDGWREREGYRVTFRRAQLHMALGYAQAKHIIDKREADAWRALLIRTGEDVLSHFNQFREKHPALDNRGFGTGINHVALSAEGIWKSGEILGRPDWQDMAGGFFDRLIAYGHPDGYFEEHSNDAREGGPSILYTPLTAGSAYLTQRWRGKVNRTRFETMGAFYRRFVDAHLHPMPFADERANPHRVGPYGLALHSITPEGRGFLRLILDQIDMTDPVGGDMYLQFLARVYVELSNMDTGPGAVPEPFHDGAFRLSVPLGVVRKNQWTAGISAMKALNRVQSPKSDYALDRQSLFSLSHATAGLILEGVKAKHNPDWSTVRLGDNAYPVQTGDLDVRPDGATARVIYEGFDVHIEWTLGEIARLQMTSDFKGPLTAQLPLEIGMGQTVRLNGKLDIALGEEKAQYEHISRVETDHWIAETDQPGALVWYIAPFNPYSEGNRSAPETRRASLVVTWTGSITCSFRAKPVQD